MQLAVIQRILGLLLILFSISMLPPMIIAGYKSEPVWTAFGAAMLLLACGGGILWWPCRKVDKELRLRDGFVIVVLFWTGLGLAGAIPLYITPQLALSFTDAAFESISALTTTGATVLVGIDQLPMSVQFYRHQLQWMGGMGIIVLAVAILPMLGVGGMQLYRAETPAPFKDVKMTPRITETAKALWYLYLALTILCALCYRLAGMSLFDAVCHSFSTISIGGFSTHDANMGYFESPAINYVAVLFMFLAGINFALHFMAWNRKTLRPYFNNSEFRAYCRIVAAVCLVCIGWQLITSRGTGVSETVEHSIFQAVSITTTTGFQTADYGQWPGFLTTLLLMASFIGACGGSTGGGLKVVRVLLLCKQGVREIKRLVHPRGVFLIKLGNEPLTERITDAVWGHLAVFTAVFLVLLLTLLACGLDQLTAFSALAACINNLGPGLGAVSDHYGAISSAAKWLLCLAMIMGRLEILTVLVILSPIFWRR